MKTHALPRREDILNVLRSSRSLLDGFGVARLSLFGSFARDEGGEDSDVDLLVEFNRPIGLFEFVRLQRQLGEDAGPSRGGHHADRRGHKCSDYLARLK
jgi:predicted nucleotidyltransferase